MARKNDLLSLMERNTRLAAGQQMKMRAQAEINLMTKQLLRAVDNTDRETFDWFAKSVAGRAKELVRKDTWRLHDSIKGSVRKKYGGKPGEVTASIRTNTKGMPRYYGVQAAGRSAAANRKRAKEKGLRVIVYGYGADVEVGKPNYTSTPYLRPAFAQKLTELPGHMKREFAAEAVKHNVGRGG